MLLESFSLHPIVYVSRISTVKVYFGSEIMLASALLAALRMLAYIQCSLHVKLKAMHSM